MRLKGTEADIHYRHTTSLPKPGVPPLAFLALLALVVVGLLAWYLIPPALQESRQDQFASLVEEAGIGLDTALATEDPDQRRALLEDASRRLAEAEALRPDDPQVTALRAQVQAALTELDAVLELPALALIADLSERVPGAFSTRVLALGDDGAYFLDREQGRVVAVTLLAPNPDPVILFRAGDPVGTEIAGRPQGIAWAQDLGALLILDDARRLIAVRFGEAPRLLTVRAAQDWGSADGIAYASESLYVLDREADQVWRYLRTESGFDSERQGILPTVDLEPALELAVGDALYLVMNDATILRSQFGIAETLSQAGIDQALVSPASPVPLPASGRLLVADRGNKRIVVLSLEGTFLQQWVSPTAFTDLRAIAVDEANGLLYILAGEALYRTPLPSPP